MFFIFAEPEMGLAEKFSSHLQIKERLKSFHVSSVRGILN